MWAGTFDALLLDVSRPEAEMPLHLPEAPAPSEPWIPPPLGGTDNDGDGDDDDGDGDGDGDDGDVDRRRRRRRLLESNRPHYAQHCGASEQTCRGANVLSIKQERAIAHYAELTGQQV
jgi:hypothetical protein